MENYYCYFELNFDSDEFNTALIEYSMGGIPVRLAYNSDRLLSYLLFFYILKHKNIDVQDVVFIAKNGIAWQVVELEPNIHYLIANDGGISVGVFDQLCFPALEYALLDYQKIYLREVKLIDQIHFESLKNMYEPNFDLTI